MHCHRWLLLCGFAMIAAPQTVQTAQAGTDAAQLYDLVIELGMPHLDEAMRYATRRERVCLRPAERWSTFSMLNDVSLSDCRLVAAQDTLPERERSVLECSGGHGTTGEARWQRDGSNVSGVLEVRLGGKNMTFHQRVRGQAIGAC